MTTFQFYASIGVQHLQCDEATVFQLCDEAAAAMEACRYFVVFQPTADGKTEIQDGDGTVVKTIDLNIPETIWAEPSGLFGIPGTRDDGTAITLYLPEEH